MGHSYGAVAALYAAADSPDLAAVVADGAFISFEDMVSRATILLSRDPERSFWERFGLRLAGFRSVEWAVKPIYYLRTGIWLSQEETNTLVPISQLGTRPILFISGEKDEICPPQNARIMFDMARSSQKRLLVIPNADHDTTFQTDPHLYESVLIQFLQEAFSERKKDDGTGNSFRSCCDLNPRIQSSTADCQPKQAGFPSHGGHSLHDGLD
jgi:pimeloyl-ACP methyl ester carboxylesterase